jgi:hypothetical protein
MLKSIVVVVGSYLLSVILVLATNPLLSRLLPGDFVRTNSVEYRSADQYGVVCTDFDSMRLAVRKVCTSKGWRARAYVLRHRRGDGYRRDHSELEQRLASLVWVVVVARLASELLDRTDVGTSSAASADDSGQLEAIRSP